MKNSLILLLPALLLMTAGCSRHSTSATTLRIPPEVQLPIEQINFDYLEGKARMVLQDGLKEREVKANIRVRKDSVIWMTFSVVGVHGGKALMDGDSITVVNNVEKQYYVFEYGELTKRFNFNVDYHMIQAAALGNLILPRKETDEVTLADTIGILKQVSGSVTVLNYVNMHTKKIDKVVLHEQNTNNSLTIDYSNFQPLGDKLFPYNGTISLFYKSPTGLLNTTITFEYNKAEVADKELKFPFNIPKRYDRR